MNDLTNLIEWTEFAADGKNVGEVLTILNNRHQEAVGNLERERDEACKELDANGFVLQKLQDERDTYIGKFEQVEKQLEAMREAIGVAADALRAWPKAGHGMSTDHTLQSQAFRTGQAALAKLQPFLKP